MSDQHSNYSISLNLSPRSGELRADVALDYLLTAATDTLDFILHRSLWPVQVTGEAVTGYERLEQCSCPFITDGVTIRVQLSRPHQAGEICSLQFSYAGRPGIASQWQVNRLTPEWVELGLYAPWFPFRNDELFTYRVHVTTDPGYDVIGLGTTELRDDAWLVSSDQPGADITLLAAPQFECTERSAGNSTILAYYTDPADSTLASRTAEDGQRALGFLDGWLGADGRTAKTPTIVVAPRIIGGAYVRPGLVVMSRPEEGSQPDPLRQLRWIAHEFAHLWWFKASTSSWEDWLNESFAEFSSFVAVREFFGEEAAAERLNMMRSRTENLPPIMGLPRTHEKAWDVLYLKGCVILADLEQMIGREKMTEFLRTAIHRRVTSTTALLAVLAEVAGAEAASTLSASLQA